MEKAEQLLSENQSLVAMIKQCLHNNPALRPRTGELVMKLRGEVTPGEYIQFTQSSSLPQFFLPLSLIAPERQLPEANSDNSHTGSRASGRDTGILSYILQKVTGAPVMSPIPPIHIGLSSSQARPTRRTRETHSPVPTANRQKLSSELS